MRHFRCRDSARHLASPLVLHFLARVAFLPHCAPVRAALRETKGKGRDALGDSERRFAEPPARVRGARAQLACRAIADCMLNGTVTGPPPQVRRSFSQFRRFLEVCPTEWI